MPASKTKTSITLLAGIIGMLLVVTTVFSLFTVNRLKSNLDIQVHTTTVVTALGNNLIYLLDAETGERGFVITADSNYLEPYNLALKNIEHSTEQLRTLIKDNPIQQKNMVVLEHLINTQLQRISAFISFKKRADEKTLLTQIIRNSNEGKKIMDSIRIINQSMQDEELKLFAKRRANTNLSITNAQMIFVIEGIFSLLITLSLTIVIFRELKRRAKAEKKTNDFNVELIRKNKEIEQFAYVASHDLQEPLRTVSNFSQLLAQKIDAYADKEAGEYISYINSGAKRMSSLIFDLLEYSRIGKETGTVLIDCNTLVRELLTDMATSIKESHAEIHVDRLPVLYGFIELRSIFQNLLSNAIKFRKEGVDPVINISAKNNEKEFVFSIKDNGIGIEEIYYERIFLIFQRLHTRAEYEGTGIGLSQCKKIIDLHGGKIWIESKLAKGSTFYFTIPKSEKSS